MKIDDIEITLKRKNIKNIYLKVVPPDGEVKVSAPFFVSDEDIINFIDSKKDWILKNRELILTKQIKAPYNYKNGEIHKVWGEEFTLQLISNENYKDAFVDKNKKILYLPVPKRSNLNTRQKVLTEFYRSELKKEIPQALDKCVKIVGETPNEVKVRNMKNWGNCRLLNRRITLNLKLASKRKICLEYVMIHELTHLIEFNHGKNFKKLMDKFCPNWREIKKELNE